MSDAIKATQEVLNPNAATTEIIKSRKKGDRKKKAVVIFQSKKPYHEIVKDALIGNIYLITAQRSTLQQLTSLHLIHTNHGPLEDFCRILGCYSFNHFLRNYEHLFRQFLEIFVTKSVKKTTASESPFLLNYYNNKIQQNQRLRNSMMDAMNEEPKPDRDRYLIKYEQTKYFEFHNSLDYIDGRKNFAKVINFCKRQGLFNRNGYVPLNKFQQGCQNLFGSTTATLIKKWFPRCGGMENVMRKITFEEVDCSFSCQKTRKETEFRIKPGCTYDEICENLDLLKEEITQFYDKVDRDLSIALLASNQRNHVARYESKYNNIKRKEVQILHEREKGCFDESDEDAVDLRIENKPFFVVIPRQDQYKGGGNNAAVGKKVGGEKEIQKPRFQDYNELVEKRRLLPDYDLDAFVPEFKVMDVGCSIDDALKPEADKSDAIKINYSLNAVGNVDPTSTLQQNENKLVTSSTVSLSNEMPLDSLKSEQINDSKMDKESSSDQTPTLVNEADSLQLEALIEVKNQARLIHAVPKAISTTEALPTTPSSTSTAVSRIPTSLPQKSEEEEDCEYTDDENNVFVNIFQHSKTEKTQENENRSLSQSALPHQPKPRGRSNDLLNLSQMSDSSNNEDSVALKTAPLKEDSKNKKIVKVNDDKKQAEVVKAVSTAEVKSSNIQIQKAAEIVQKSSTPIPSDFVDCYKIHNDFLRAYCEKLGIEYSNEAENFMKNIDIQDFSVLSTPLSMGQPNNGFATMSLFLTGKDSTSMVSEVKEKIKQFIFKNVNTLEQEHDFRFTHASIGDFVFSDNLTDQHLLCLSHLLECRFWVYCSNSWKLFGSWKNSREKIPTFFMDFKMENYAPIFAVQID
uniref:Uncharacterized protein n=1 Tax=Panagrolaimus sp. ES5 TaxID=591445 RepID=A0AC34GS13_9BILA